MRDVQLGIMYLRITDRKWVAGCEKHVLCCADKLIRILIRTVALD